MSDASTTPLPSPAPDVGLAIGADTDVAIATSTSTIVVASNAQPLRRVDLRVTASAAGSADVTR